MQNFKNIVKNIRKPIVSIYPIVNKLWENTPTAKNPESKRQASSQKGKAKILKGGHVVKKIENQRAKEVKNK